jgi:hypothetical protein
MTDLPIACTLPAAAVPDRLALIESLAPLDREPIPGGSRLRFRPDAEPRVRELVALEAECCPFLTFAVTRDDDAVVVDVTGAPDAQPVIAQFFA